MPFSLLRRILPVAIGVVGVLFPALSAVAAPLLVKTEPGATVLFAPQAGGDPVALGVVDADGILLVAEAPEAAGTLVLSHPDAEAALAVEFVPGKTPGKISPELKLRPATLLISALPEGEAEVFVDGKHRGRGVVTLGGIEPRRNHTVEVRTARRGMQSRLVVLQPGEMQTVKFDLRGNEIISAKPAGQIVLPELPLVLASQAGAIVKADGAAVDLDADGVLRGVEPGERVVEIYLPWQGREVCVWRAAVPARSALLPGADAVAVPNPVRDVPVAEEPLPATQQTADDPASEQTPAPSSVVMVLGRNVVVSLGSAQGLANGAKASVAFGAPDAEPVEVDVYGVAPKEATLRLPDGVPAPKEGASVHLVAPQLSKKP